MRQRFWLIIVLLCTLSITSFSQHTISGYVTEQGSAEVLIGASVYERNSMAGTATNVYGFYSLTVPSDTVELRASYVGFGTYKQRLVLSSDTTINIALITSDLLPEVEVVAQEQEKLVESTQMSSVEISMEQVKSMPVFMGEPDVIKTLQMLPGVQSGSEGSSGLYVRGGGPDQNLILLDGVPVYNAAHLFGFFSVFNPDAINHVELIKGGFPARYGGRLSSVLDIRMKEGSRDSLHGEGGIGLIASRFTLEGPMLKKNGSFIVSARRTYIDILAQPFIRAVNNSNSVKGGGGYFFHDYNAKFNYQFSDKDRVYLSAYTGRDKFYLNLNSETENYADHYEWREKANLNWGNFTSALRWNHLFTNKLFSNTTLIYSRYRFNIEDNWYSKYNFDSQVEETEYYYKYSSGIQDIGLNYDVDYVPNNKHLIKTGFLITHHTFSPGIATFGDSYNGTTGTDTSFGQSNVQGLESRIYLEDDFVFGKRWKANVGLHGGMLYVENTSYFSLEPRAALRYLVNDKWSVKASGVRMSQFLHLLTNAGIGLPTDLWLPATQRIRPESSWQVAAGTAYSPNKDLEITVEGYYKHMDGLIEYKEGASFFSEDIEWENKVEQGQGWSYGGEFFVRKKAGDFSGWVGYTLSWTERQFDNVNFGEVFPYKYDRRHDISITTTYDINKRLSVGANWVYGTGDAVTLPVERYTTILPTGGWFTDIQSIESRNGFRSPNYHRLDVSVTLKKRQKWGESSWNLGLYNAYNRRNPFFLFAESDIEGRSKIRMFSLFPVLPFFNYQFSF